MNRKTPPHMILWAEARHLARKLRRHAGEKTDSSSIRDAIGEYALVLKKTDQALGIVIRGGMRIEYEDFMSRGRRTFLQEKEDLEARLAQVEAAEAGPAAIAAAKAAPAKPAVGGAASPQVIASTLSGQRHDALPQARFRYLMSNVQM